MVYIIRHKGFWDYKVGQGMYDRSFHSFIKGLNPPRDQTAFISWKNPFYFSFRYLHLYRTLTRAANQYFQGNQLLAQTFSMQLRSFYESVPNEYILKVRGSWDQLIHKGERHWESMTYNQHPLLHDLYEMFNKYCHEHYGKTESEVARAKNFVAEFEELLKKKRERLGLEYWQVLDTKDINDSFFELMSKERNDSSSSLYVKNKSGDDVPRRESKVI